MAYDYSDLEQCKQLVIDLTGITASLKAVLIEQNLVDSAAQGPLGTTYRPYYVAARQLQRNRPDQTIESADGAKFTNLTTMIQSLLEEQLAYDLANDLVVPEGYGAKDALNKLCGCKNDSLYTPMMAILVG